MGKVAAVETAAGAKVREVTAIAASGGAVDVTVATATGTSAERYPASSVWAQETRAARIASEVAQASRGAAGTLPLAAAAPHPTSSFAQVGYPR
jgi:hypothetical protein